MENYLTNELNAMTMAELIKCSNETFDIPRGKQTSPLRKSRKRSKRMRWCISKAYVWTPRKPTNTWHVTACTPITCLGTT